MFHAHNRENINITWEADVWSKIIMTMIVTRLFHTTTQNLQDQDYSVQDQDQDQDRFFWSQTAVLS